MKRPAKDPSLPDVGKILARLREQRNVTVRELAEATDLSESFIRAVERGESDISLGRLARLARFFEYDLGSFLGFTSRLSRPNFVGREGRATINRGRGVKYEALHLPGIDLDFVTVELGPHSKLKDELTHEGIDVVYVTQGEVVVVVDGIDYPMSERECCVFSAAYRHRVRNDSNSAASIVSITTGRMY
ncbi:MAG TPA: XRE family transcriptional regulator [Candidatus Baltobacteraceae bacterium]|jgi:transcriptional regulator with XRE-family HTH domain|nr:XRE family transcriptional regulator [Candidatus Baltobacteraceae bacterium]